MSRLVVVSNRLPSLPSALRGDERLTPVGGLASALQAALRRSPGSVWLGWDGATAHAGGAAAPVLHEIDRITLVGVPLTQREQADHYRGFCNEALWPLCHGFLGRVRLDAGHEAAYRRVNHRFAAALLPMLRSTDRIWVHDYHFMLFARELREMGWRGPIGFFLHVPFPPYDLWQILPDPRGLILALEEFDLVGFQTRLSLDNYRHARRVLLETIPSRRHADGVYPIGIDPAAFAPPAAPDRRSRRRGELTRVVRGRRLILGVDRLDYTKGIPERILAFEALIRAHHKWRKKVSFVQIASPTRSRLPQYVEQKQRVDHLVGRVNGELADHDWVPIRYLYRSYPAEALARFYREADVGLVTPLRDGMNLIAKEYVAAQDPAAPGVLVLSRFAGAAEQMPEALLVNPFIPEDTAAGIARALEMPAEERRERHAALLATVKTATASEWSAAFLRDLESAADASGGAPARALTVRARRP